MSIMDLQENDLTPPDTAPGEGMLTCEKCGNSFEHSGKGRKPKRCPDCRSVRETPVASRRTTSKDVESAIAVLDGMYNLVSLGLFMLNPKAAGVWNAQVDELQKQNRVTLAGDPNLTKSILRVGEKSGRTAFVLAHAFAVAPVVGVIVADLPPKQKKAKPTAANGHDFSEPENDLTAEIPNMSFFG